MYFVKKMILAVALAVYFVGCASAQKSGIDVATWNIRINIKQDSLNGDVWSSRRNAIAEIVKKNDFDIMGVQEDYQKELNELNSSLKDYRRIGFPNHENGRLGSFNSIFFKKDRFSVLDSGMFYFAEDEREPALGWNGKYIRSCSWLSLKEKSSGVKLWVFNAHTDYAGGDVERESSKMLLRKIEELAGKDAKAIVMGDLNFTQFAEGYKILNESGLVKDSRDAAEEVVNGGGTFNAFDENHHSDERLDHIFITKTVPVQTYDILLDTYEKDGKKRFPSDHYPVVLKLKL